MIKKMVPLLLALQLITIMTLSANTSAKFDFSTWKVQLPEARENSTSVKEVHGPELTQGYTSDYFYYNSQGSIVLYCPVGASSTANSNYSRSELRELIDGVHTNVNWSLNGTHILNTEEKVTQVPSNGRTVVSQIHGIYPDGSNGPVLVKVEYDGLQESVVVLLKTATYKNAADERFYLRNIKLDEVFNITIKVVEGRVFVTVISGDKKLEASKDFYKLDPTWENYRFYFKVGNYVQDSIIDYEGEAATVLLNDFNTYHTDKIESVPPTSLNLIETLQIEKGNEFQIQGIFKPFDTTNTISKWEIVSGNDVIDLSSNGYVTAKKEGIAIIKATSKANPMISDTSTITVTKQTIKTTKLLYKEDFEKNLGSEWEFKNAENDNLTVENGKLNFIDKDKTKSIKAILTLENIVGTTTVEYETTLSRVDIKDRGNTKEQSSYYYFDVNSDSNDNLFRIRSKSDLIDGKLSNPRIVLSKSYLEPEINVEAAKTPLNSLHTITLIIHTDDNTSKANTTDIYIDGKNIGNSINNSSKEKGISRIEIYSGTKDMLDFSIDNLIVYAGEKLPKGAEPVIKSSKNTEIVTQPIKLKTLTGKTIDFDNLKAGVQIDSTSDYWSVQKVNGTTIIAEISTTESKSAPNSLYLLDNSSSDKPYALLNFPNGQSAKGTVSFSSFIPSTNPKTVYVNIGVGKNNSDRYIELRLQGSGLLQYENGSDDKDIGRFSTDEWHTFAVTWENGLFTVFVDGIPSDNATDISVKSTGLSTSNIPKTITFYVGDKSSTGTKAYIDDIKSDQF